MITKKDIALSKLLRQPKLVEVVCTVTTASGETSSNKAVIMKNKINKLHGNGLTSKALYDLYKLGRCESVDMHGTKFVYEASPYKASAPKQLPTDADQGALPGEEIKND